MGIDFSSFPPAAWVVIGAAALLLIILFAKGFKIAFKGALSFITWSLFIALIVGIVYLIIIR